MCLKEYTIIEVEKKPKIAVLLAAYNGEKWISEQIFSILHQKNVEVDIYVSVDISTDRTLTIVENISESYSGVQVLQYGEHFGSAGANFFRLVKDVDFSMYDAVSFSDQDDIWREDKLFCAYSYIDSGFCDVYSSNVLAFWSDGKKKLIKKDYKQKRFDHFFEAAGPGCTYVLNKDSIREFKYFLVRLGSSVDHVFLHDWLAYAFCREHGFNWFIDSYPSLLYRQHEANQVGINSGVAAFKNRVRLINKKWYRNQVELILELVAPQKKKYLEKRLSLLMRVKEFRRRPIDCFFLFLMIFFRVY